MALATKVNNCRLRNLVGVLASLARKWGGCWKAVDASLIERSGRDGLQITVLPRLRSVTENFYVTPFLLCHYLQMALNRVGRG
jgi:hypothetical protein